MEFLGKTLDTFNLRDIEKSVKALRDSGTKRVRLTLYETANGKAKISRIFEANAAGVLIKNGHFVASLRRAILEERDNETADYFTIEALPDQ